MKKKAPKLKAKPAGLPSHVKNRQEFDNYNISRAVSFVAYLRISPQQVFRKEFVVRSDNTREKAKLAAFKEADRITKNSPYGRGACVYAVTPENWTSFVDRPK